MVISFVDESLFFSAMMMDDAKFEVEGYIMSAFSKSVNSFLSQAWCLRGNIYSFFV